MKTVSLEVDGGLATLRMSRAHGNAINGDLADDLTAACRETAEDPSIRGAMLTGAGKLFCPGLDLQELIELDRPEMERFVDRFAVCILALYTYPKPMVARIHGHAVAGGCVLSLTADWRVLREGVMVGLNEVRVGVPFPFGVSMILRESAPSPKVEEVALFGRNYSGEDAVAAGLVHEVRPDEHFEEDCRARLDELASRHPEAFAISKRYLRSPVVDRIRSREGDLARDFLECWFSPDTRVRMQGIVDELRHRPGKP